MSNQKPPGKDDPTLQFPAEVTPQSGSGSSRRGIERYAPGAIVAGRYRIINRLGAGGMGEVYRADDIKLDQPVALKFLPAQLSADPELLARLHSEVRVGRTLAHPSLCRLYDIAESDGVHFIAMEYVAGEDLETLLRRIGRFPHDRALIVAHQLCSGLAAVHDKGIIHRDLKPANVMIDSDGDVRITDFGVAAHVTDTGESGILIGTPSYMAPEQFAGTPANPLTDIYALGLILFELFTGKKALTGRTLHELLAEHRSGEITNPSSVVRDIDPAVNRAIVRCLSKDPAGRPQSARELARSLPGGDPLAAALAAGETPSPQLVASAGAEGALSPVAAWSWLAGIIALYIVSAFTAGQHAIYNLAPIEKPDVLESKARETVAAVGGASPAGSSARGFTSDAAVVALLQASAHDVNDWRRRATIAAPIRFWYRESSTPLTPLVGTLTGSDDPPLRDGDTLVELDGSGRLLHLERLPLAGQGSSGSHVDWPAMIARSPLPAAASHAAAVDFTPPHFADQLNGWSTPTLLGQQTIHAASLHGVPVFFDVDGPWNRRGSPKIRQDFNSPLFSVVFLTLYGLVFALAAAVTWRNVRRGRADRRGVMVLALITFVMTFAGDLMSATHGLSFKHESIILRRAMGDATEQAVLLAIVYLALEPFIRRRWPELIVGWSRLINRRSGDPLVGRDLLVGIAGGLGQAMLGHLASVSPMIRGRAPLATPNGLQMLSGADRVLGAIAVYCVRPLLQALFMLFAVVVIFAVARSRKATFLIATVIFAVILFLGLGALPLWITPLLIAIMSTLVLMRVGLLAMIAYQLTFFLTWAFPLPSGVRAWYNLSAAPSAIVIAALALYGFRASIRGHKAFRFSLLDEPDDAAL